MECYVPAFCPLGADDPHMLVLVSRLLSRLLLMGAGLRLGLDTAGTSSREEISQSSSSSSSVYWKTWRQILQLVKQVSIRYIITNVQTQVQVAFNCFFYLQIFLFIVLYVFDNRWPLLEHIYAPCWFLWASRFQLLLQAFAKSFDITYKKHNILDLPWKFFCFLSDATIPHPPYYKKSSPRFHSGPCVCLAVRRWSHPSRCRPSTRCRSCSVRSQLFCLREWSCAGSRTDVFWPFVLSRWLG